MRRAESQDCRCGKALGDGSNVELRAYGKRCPDSWGVRFLHDYGAVLRNPNHTGEAAVSLRLDDRIEPWRGKLRRRLRRSTCQRRGGETYNANESAVRMIAVTKDFA